MLERGSWSASIVDELAPAPSDIQVAKYRMSGFQDTMLDSILRNLNVTTLLFAGVNADQCVLCTLQSANFLGYDCFLIEDCSATTSPDYCICLLYTSPLPGPAGVKSACVNGMHFAWL